jgi:hypothetical protein
MKDKMVIELTEEYEAEILTSLLAENGIQSIVKKPFTGGYMQIAMGFTIYGIQLFVKPQDFDEASKLIEEFYSQVIE